MKSIVPSKVDALKARVLAVGFSRMVWFKPLSVKLPFKKPVIVAPELVLVFSDLIWLVKVAWLVTVTEVNVPSAGSNKARGGASGKSMKFVKVVGSVITCVIVTGTGV